MIYVILLFKILMTIYARISCIMRTQHGVRYIHRHVLIYAIIIYDGIINLYGRFTNKASRKAILYI